MDKSIWSKFRKLYTDQLFSGNSKSQNTVSVFILGFLEHETVFLR